MKRTRLHTKKQGGGTRWASLLTSLLIGLLLGAVPASAQDSCDERTDLNPFALTGGMEQFHTAVYKDDVNTTTFGWGDGKGQTYLECTGTDCLLLPISGIEFTGMNSTTISTNWMKSAAGGDFDGDGDDDMVVGGNRFPHPDCSADGALAFLPNETLDGNFATQTRIDCGDGDSVKGMTSGDFDNDGDLDVASYDKAGHLRIWFNDGAAGFTNPNGIEYTVSAMSWETGVATADIDGDGWLDLVLANDAGTGGLHYLKNKKDGTFTFMFPEINAGYPRTNVVGLADFDGDGDIDIIVGSTFNSTEIRLLENVGNGNFACGAGCIVGNVTKPTNLNVADFNKDGKPDFAVGTDNPGNLWYYENTHDGSSQSPVTFQDTYLGGNTIDPTIVDFDNAGIGDFDGNGYMDIFIADGNHAQKAFVYLNEALTNYAADGLAQSTNVANIDATQYAITSAAFEVTDVVYPNTSITYYLSNDGGRNWYEVNASNGWTAVFGTYGADLRWKAELHTDDINVTPFIKTIDMSFSYVAKTEFYRSEIVIDPRDPDENNHATLYAGSFMAPSPSTVSPLWTATGQGNNTIYSSNASNTRCTLSACPGSLTGAEVSSITDLSLGGIDHSAPAVVGAPVYPFWFWYYASPSNERESFRVFKNARANRERMVYVGATDGMLHAIRADEASNGAELWRYLPRHNNPQIVNNLAYPPYDDAKVDASPSVADVLFSYMGSPAASDWHTVLVSPLGRERNVVFALDITDPTNPGVLWEFPGASNLGGIRSHPGILRMKVDGKTKYVAMISSGIENDNKDGFAVYALDIETGAKIWEFRRTDCADPSGSFLPGSVSAIDSDYDGYVDRAYVGDFIGRLWEFTFDAAADMTDSTLDDDWVGSVLYTDPMGNRIYARPALAFDSTGNLVVYFGTAGDTDNRFYAIYAKHKTDSNNDGTAKYTIGDGDGYIGNAKVYAAPILNRGRATFITSTGAADTWAFCSESAGSSGIITVSADGSNVRVTATAKTTSTAQAVDGETITIDQRGHFGVDDPSSGPDPIPGDPPPPESGDPALRVNGWYQE